MSSAPRASILVVDDDPHGLLAMRDALGRPDRHVVAVESGREALQHVLTTDFALVVLDVRMPGMDGFETAALIRQRKRSRQTPIMFLTAAHADLESDLRGYR